MAKIREDIDRLKEYRTALIESRYTPIGSYCMRAIDATQSVI
jgi:hypothetical protein